MRFSPVFKPQMIFISPFEKHPSRGFPSLPEVPALAPRGKEKTSPRFREEVLLVLFHFAADFRRPVLCEIRDPEYRSRHLPECFL